MGLFLSKQIFPQTSYSDEILLGGIQFRGALRPGIITISAVEGVVEGMFVQWEGGMKLKGFS